MLDRGDIGHRVVIRHIVAVRDGRPVFTDVLGELTAFEDAYATVDGKHGQVSISRRAIVAGKRIPPRPQTRPGPPPPGATA